MASKPASAENPGPVSSEATPEGRFVTVDPNESPDRVDGYCGVDTDYQNATDVRYAPNGDEQFVTSVESVPDVETPAQEKPTTPVAPKSPGA